MDKRLRGIFQTDDGADIRATYREAILSGMSEDEAEQLTVSDLPTENVWVILALVEWEIGRLSEKAKQNALERLEVLLEKNGDSNSSKAERLNLVRETLLSPMPEKKKLRTPWYVYKSPWEAGNVVQYKMTSTADGADHPLLGCYVLLQVLGTENPPPGKLHYGSTRFAAYAYASRQPIVLLPPDDPSFTGIKRMELAWIFKGKRTVRQSVTLNLTRSFVKEHEMVRISEHPLDGSTVENLPVQWPDSFLETYLRISLSELNLIPSKE